MPQTAHIIYNSFSVCGGVGGGGIAVNPHPHISPNTSSLLSRGCFQNSICQNHTNQSLPASTVTYTHASQTDSSTWLWAGHSNRTETGTDGSQENIPGLWECPTRRSRWGSWRRSCRPWCPAACTSASGARKGATRRAWGTQMLSV